MHACHIEFTYIAIDYQFETRIDAVVNDYISHNFDRYSLTQGSVYTCMILKFRQRELVLVRTREKRGRLKETSESKRVLSGKHRNLKKHAVAVVNQISNSKTYKK